jgi:hypothetical protein
MSWLTATLACDATLNLHMVVLILRKLLMAVQLDFAKVFDFTDGFLLDYCPLQ